MSEYQELPEGYEADTEDFDALYVLAWALIIRALMQLTRLPQNPTSTDLLKLEKKVQNDIAAIVVDLNKKAIPLAKKQVTEAYIEGVKYSHLAISQENKLHELKPVENEEIEIDLNRDHKKRLQAMIEQTQADLLKATHNTENNIKELVRKVVAKEMSTAGKSGMKGKQSNMAIRIEQQLRKQFLMNGIKDADVAIIDKAKRKWKLKTYSSMVARTKMNMAYIDAIREEALQDGHDLAIISTKPDTTDACLNYEGMIISLNGLTAGYLTYDQIKLTKLCFHPNCGHFVRPVAGLNWIPKKLLAIHEKQMKKYNLNKDTLKQQTHRDAV